MNDFEDQESKIQESGTMVISANIKFAILIIPSFSASDITVSNKFAEAISYSQWDIKQPKLKDTLHHNTMTMEELIRENNEKVLQKIYKTLE